MNYFTNLQLKTTFKAENSYLIFSLKKKDHINENQLQFLQNKLNHGILNATWTKAGNGNRLVFDISNLVCISEYIKAEMTQEKYFDFILQFQKIMEFCSNSIMPAQNLLCNLKYSYYSPSTQKLYFAYLPVTDNSYRNNIVKFLYEMHRKANIIISNGNTMNRYQEYLERLLLIQKKTKTTALYFRTMICITYLTIYLHHSKIPSSAIYPSINLITPIRTYISFIQQKTTEAWPDHPLTPGIIIREQSRLPAIMNPQQIRQ